ncbi:MAG: BspA family leucine-rich repeat surface protein [Ruminococcus sp.]|nr:BspA family leucine-rich repeat surface protein [Ruminococcus sp.]
MSGKLKKRILSGLSAFAMLTANLLPLAPIGAKAAQAAHTINVFDINIRQGAVRYDTYKPDDVADNGTASFDNVYVWKADSSNEGHKFVYNIKFSVSGEGTGNDETDDDNIKKAVGEGFINIRVPAHILKYKGDNTVKADDSGVYPDEAEMPVPNIEQMTYREVDDGHGGKTRIYSTDHQFVYRLDDKGTDDEADDEYIIYNIKPVSAGVVYEFPIAYKTNKNTWEYQDMGASTPCKAYVEVKSWDKEKGVNTPQTITSQTREVPVYIDTNATIKSTSKSANATLLTAKDAQKQFGISGLDENYRYTIWTVTSDITGVTQKYDLDMTDTAGNLIGTDAQENAHTIHGETVAVKMNGQIITPVNKDGFDAPVYEQTGLTASGKRVDYVLTRYLYNSVKNAQGGVISEGIDALYEAIDFNRAVYIAENDAQMYLTPCDKQDKMTDEAASARFKLEIKEPEWRPVDEKYSADKWGLFNNATQRVGSKNNVTSYELAKLLTDREIKDIKYETKVSAHAYGRTILTLNDEIKKMDAPRALNADGTADITAGSRKYHFDTNAKTCTVTVYDSDAMQSVVESYPIHISQTDELSLINMRRIAAQDIADNYYGQHALDYVFEDKTLNIADMRDASNKTALDRNDYRIDSFEYKYNVKAAVYDSDNMQFSAGKENEGLSENDSDNTLYFYAYVNGGDTASAVGSYNIRTGQANITDPSVISSLDGSKVVFRESANVTGYQVKTTNRYFFLDLTTKPSITLKPSDKVKAIVEPIINSNGSEKKIGIDNTANWTVKHDSSTLLNENKTGTDYIADIVRTSTISKKAFGEKQSVKGRDGKVYSSRNDTLEGEYELVWQTKVAETADGVEIGGRISNNVPVPQRSGVFYDLLPAHSDIIEGSVNVFVDNFDDASVNSTPLAPSSFEVLPRIDNYNGSGKKLMVIKINAPCNISYTVTYMTVHSHEDIQDYGSFALNTVAYQTGNEDIGKGYPDDGGNYAVSMSRYIKRLDPNNNGAKRFIYAESTEDILALFPTSSGIYKKVSSMSDPVGKRSAVVHNGENYTYHIRMKNDSSTKARDIAILDSLENYRTVDGVAYNSGLKYDRDWNGTIESFDLSGVEDKIAEYAKTHSSTSVNDLKLIVYTGSGIVDLDKENYSDSEQRKDLLNDILEGNTTGAASDWHVVPNWRDLSGFDRSKITAYIVYTGKHFVLAKGDSMSFKVNMKAPDEVTVTKQPDVENGIFIPQPKTYNNIYRSFTTIPEEKDDDEQTDVTYFYTHYDYTQVEYSTVGTLRFTKAGSVDKKPAAGVQFSLSGISDYGTAYDETLVSDTNGVVEFKNLQRGTYQLIESVSDPDHQLDPTPRTVNVDPRGKVTIVTVDGVVVDDGAGHFTIYNKPRYHGELEFKKGDLLSGEGISGAQFILNGTSIYNNEYKNITAVSDENGRVSFGDIEKGEYTITEVQPANGYLPPNVNTYKVTCSGDEVMVFKISGENLTDQGTQYVINNVPTAEMTLQKVDAITKDTLDDAEFTITADESLNDTIRNLTEKVQGTLWEFSDGKWTQKVSGGTSGRYILRYLAQGTYTLTETKAPTHYESSNESYTINVDKSADGKKLVVKLPDDKPEWEYIKIENGEFVTATADTALYQRLNNNQVYEDGKTIIKSWVGAVDSSFPSLHLSNEKPKMNTVKVTIGTDFQTLIQNNRSNFTGLVRDSSLPDGKEPMVDRTEDSKDETGLFYAWWDSNDKKVHWYSDADVIYLPRDCSSLFDGCNNSGFTTFDLSAKTTGTQFSAEKTTKMYRMFYYCSKLGTVNFSFMVDTPELITTQEMFQGCSALANIDFSNWANAEKFETMHSMFNKCSSLKSVDFSNLVIPGFKNAQQMFLNCSKLENVIFGKHITLYPTREKAKTDNDDKGIMSMFYGACKTNDAVIDLSGLDTRQIVAATDPKAWGIGHMFNNCSKLKTVYVSEYWDNANFITQNSDWGQKNVFSGCNSLVGGEGTTYKTNTNLNSYAKVDGGKDDPGYFTYKAAPTLESSSDTESTTTDTVNITFADYQGFTKTGSPTQVENTDATADDVGKTSFAFEYVTANTEVPTSGAESYEVDETIYMTVSQIAEDGGKYYTISQKYTYDGTAKAKWTQFGKTAPTQWKCEMKVFDADEAFYVWEDKVEGFETTADKASPIRSADRADKPVITNSDPSEKLGALELSKKLTGTDSEKFSGDKFIFKVTMKNPNGTPYTMEPFDESGVGYFTVKPNAADAEKVVIRGIPEGCTYTVEEADDALHPMPTGYTKVTSGSITGSITADTTSKAEIENRIDTVDLTLTKNIELWKKTTKGGEYVKVTDAADEDLAKWADEDFTFTVTFENLVKGERYSYKIDDTVQTDRIVGNSESSKTKKTLTIKAGQTVTFIGVPVGTVYTVTEDTSFEQTESTSYETSYAVSGGNSIALTSGKELGETALTQTADAAAFTNIKKIDRTQIPELTRVTINKEWFSTSGEKVSWSIGADGELIAPPGDYPSFLKIYLGRALKIGEGEGAIYVDVNPGYTSYSLKPKENWSYTFDDLEKYGEITLDNVTTKYPYVYFVTEVVPIGFHNCNENSQYTKMGTDNFFAAAPDGDGSSFTLKNQEDITHSLSICKLVTGNFGNKNTDFEFEITFRDSSGKALSGTGFTMQFTDLFDSSYERNRTYTLENGKVTLTLPHGKKVRFKSLPHGTQYTIRETSSKYTVSSGTYTGSAANVDVNTLTGGSEYGFTSKLQLNSDTDYLFVNDMSAEIAAGIEAPRRWVWLIMTALVGIAGCCIYIKRRKEQGE